MSRSLGEKNATQSHIVIALVALLTQEVLADKPKVLPLTPPPLGHICVHKTFKWSANWWITQEIEVICQFKNKKLNGKKLCRLTKADNYN